MDRRSVFPQNLDHQQNTIIGVRALDNTICDEIFDFDNLRQNLTHKLEMENWFVLTSQQNLHIFNLNKKLNGSLSIRNTICIDIDLIVKVFGENGDGILFKLKLYRWPQLQTLIENLSVNVKREDDLSFESAMDDDQNFKTIRCEVEDDYRINRQTDSVTFEFCATNTETVDVTEAYDLNVQPSEHLENPILISAPKRSLGLQSTSFDGDPYICSACGKTFDGDAKLIEHKRLPPSQICSICNDSVLGTMDQHMQQHFDGKFYHCHICGQKYRTSYYLWKHLQAKHLTADEPIRKKHSIFADYGNESFVPENGSDSSQWVKECPTCYKELFTTKKHTEHYTKRHDKSKWKQCPICKKSYDNLNRHISNKHSNIKTNVCHICASAYKQLSSLKEHIAVAHPQAEGFFCDICQNGRNYCSKAYLKQHITKVHDKVLPPHSKPQNPEPIYQCNLCNQQLPSRFTLKRHIARKHSEGNEIPFHCTMCDKKFALKSSLVVHQKLHAGKMHI